MLFHNVRTCNLYYVQSNLNSWNSDSSFTMANSKSFSEILLIAQENTYLVKVSYFIMELYVVSTH